MHAVQCEPGYTIHWLLGMIVIKRPWPFDVAAAGERFGDLV